MSEIEYAVNGSLSPEEAVDLLLAAGFQRPLEDLSRVQRMIDNANLLITAREDGRLVAYVRALTDFAYYCLVAEIAVYPDHQRSGIGRELLWRVRQEAGEEVNMVLTASESADSYYPKLGWQRAERAWRLRRTT